MKNSVVMKGTRSGIILVLDKDLDYDELKLDIAEKFRSSAEFLGHAQKAVMFKGRVLTEEQKLEIVDLIHANCDLNVVCIMEENEIVEGSFRRSMEKTIAERDANTGQFFKGSLRSGQVLDVETSIIIIGDVKPGANVISKGNVIILGSLKGNVYAGADGNENAFVVALDMQPVQIRIANSIARSPDKQPVKKRSKQVQPVKETKIAFLDKGNIYIEPLDKDVMNDIRL